MVPFRVQACRGGCVPGLSPTEAAGLSRGGRRIAGRILRENAKRSGWVFSCGAPMVVRCQGVARALRRIRASPATKDPTMSLHNVTPGAKAPDEFNVIIEIPMNADPIKYEVDHDTGAMFVDRFMSTAMHYPCNYGYIPQHAGRRRRPGGRAGDHAGAADPRRGGDLPPAGHAEDGRRGRRRQQAAGGADRQASCRSTRSGRSPRT